MPWPERVQCVKQESAALGGDDADSGPDVQYPINPFEDVIEAAGYELQEPDGTVRDADVMISRLGGAMTFKDQAVPTPVTLTDLLDVSDFYKEFLLNCEPVRETGAVDASYTPTYAAGRVTKEEWTRNDATLIKSIDYMYTGVMVTSEIMKVFAPDGVTVTAQVSWNYSYTGSTLTSATMTRDV